MQHERKPILDKKDPNLAGNNQQNAGQVTASGVANAANLKSTNASPQFQQRSKASSSASIYNHNLTAAAAAAANPTTAFTLDSSNLAPPEIFGLNFAELTQTLCKFFFDLNHYISF